MFSQFLNSSARYRRRRSIWKNMLQSISRRAHEYRRPHNKSSSHQYISYFSRLENSPGTKELQKILLRLYVNYVCLLPRLRHLGQEYRRKRIPLQDVLQKSKEEAQYYDLYQTSFTNNITTTNKDNNFAYAYENKIAYDDLHRIYKR